MQFSVSDPISQIINQGVEQLAPVSDSAKLDVRLLLAFALDKPVSYVLTWPERTLSQDEFTTFITLFEQRLKSTPIAYLVGQKEFWSLNFKVSPATLIPRPDTEVLVEKVLNNHPEACLNCLDLGTGTGAIALALASEKKDWVIHAVDYQDEAVALAKENAHQLALTHVTIYQSDWFSNIKEQAFFNVIVSNPPYIDEHDEHLAQGDVQFEPKSALVAEDEGYADIRHIIENAKKYLVHLGWLYIEHGFQQAKGIQAIFKAHGFIHIHTIKDYGDNDRITFGCYNVL